MGFRSLQLLLYNHQEWDAPELNHSSPSVPCEVSVTLDGIADISYRGKSRTIDATHANPRASWIGLGMPAYPSPAQHAEIMAASELLSQPVALLKVEGSSRKRELKLMLGRHAVVAVDVDIG